MQINIITDIYIYQAFCSGVPVKKLAKQYQQETKIAFDVALGHVQEVILLQQKNG